MNNITKSKYRTTGNDLLLDKIEKEYVLMIHDLSDEDKPREKMVNIGPTELTSAELLAIVINTGTKKEGVLQMTTRILKEYGNRSIVNQRDPKKLANDLNIPIYKACQIIACFELGRRYMSINTKGKVIIRTSKQAFDYLKDMRDLTKEQLRGLYLNSRYRLIHDEIISIGSLTANVVHPREVFRPAIEYGAVAVLVAHNHPSGSTKATISDIEITRQLHNSGRILGIDFLDHLIIAGDRFNSIELD